MTAFDGKKTEGRGQQRQFILLGVLSVIFGFVLYIQFGGGSENDLPVAALTAEPSQVGSLQIAQDEGEPPSLKGSEGNPVLSMKVSLDDREPYHFGSFGGDNTDFEIQVNRGENPLFVLNGTMIAEGMASLAVIDGRLISKGDIIDGWTVAEIRARSVVFQGPDQASFVLEMALFDR